MDYISTTELRTKAPKIKESLASGYTTYLIHRSKVIGVISPYISSNIVATKRNLSNLSKQLSTGKIYTPKKREAIYSQHLKKKYGKNIS